MDEGNYNVGVLKGNLWMKVIIMWGSSGVIYG